MLANPYKYKGPLDPVKDKLILVPRTDSLNEIIDGIRKGEYWAILGSRQIGKTTLLRKIKNKMRNVHHIYISFEVSPTKYKQNFYHWLMTVFLEQIPSENGPQLIKKWKNFAPDIQFFHFLENFTPKIHNKKMTLLFDEIEGLPLDFLTSLLLILKKIYQDRYQKKVFNRYAVVIAGAQNLAAATVGGENAPFDIAKVLYIRDFTPKESMELIDKPFGQLSIDIEQKAKAKLVSHVSGHPQLLQHACYNLVNIGVKHERKIVEADVDEAIGILLKENVNIDMLREDVKRNKKLKQLTRKIFVGQKEEYHLHREFSIIGAGSIVEDENAYCAIRNKVYERFLVDYLKIPMEDRIAYSNKKFEFIDMDSTTRYEVISAIGKGGISVVYKVKDINLDRIVAVKQLKEKVENNLDELKVLAIEKLYHENIAIVLDIKKPKNGRPIIIMEFVEGEDYGEIIRRDGALTINETLVIAKILFKVLKYSHGIGIIHKNIKPKNIMKDLNGKIKIMGFYIDAIDAGTAKQNNRYIIGTPGYISPEQITMEEVDHRLDIYSAGGTLFHLVTGKYPFTVRNKNEMFQKHLDEPVPSVNELRPEVPEQLIQLIEKCMQKKKEDRYQSAKEALKDVETCLKNQKEIYLKFSKSGIHEDFMSKFLDDPSHYGALPAQKVEQGSIRVSMPDKSFITIPGPVFNLISKQAVMELRQLNLQERIKERTKRVEQLFKLNLYGFTEEELRRNLELIEINHKAIPGGLKKKNLDIFKEYFTGTLLNKSIIGEDESRVQILKFQNALNFILKWDKYFVREEKTGDKTAFSAEETGKKETETKSTKLDKSSSSYDKGDQLEKKLFALFRQLFRLNESHEINLKKKEITDSDKKRKERYLEQKRWQDAGIQYGFDLEFTWKEVFVSSKSEVRQDPEIKCCIECKHYSGGIGPNELFGKLAQMSVNEDNVDHWILVSPHANLTNTAKDILKKTRKNYPFDIHIWTQEYGVEELLGIDPEVFEEFYVLPDKYKADVCLNPRLRTKEYRRTIIDKWLHKLPPKYRLPNGKLLPETWVDNLRNAGKTLISYSGEDYDNIVSERRIAISDKDRLCLTEDGSIGNLHTEFLKWLEDENSRVLAVLGEFGSGKSLHSYSLGIETAEMYLRDPVGSRIPIRLALKNCMDSNLQEVFEEQLYNMDTSYEEFSRLNPKEKILFILDGFDEMSRYITHKMTLNRFKMLYRFCDRFKDAKVLLTCRTQYFKSAEEEEEILEEFEVGKKYKIKKLYLRKFTEEEISACIRNRYSESPGDKKPQEIQKKMKSKYDLMGMSSNPLILSMITEILDDIPSDQRDISQAGIYKTYVNKWLEREISKCEITLRSQREKMQEGVKQVMYELAHQIYKKEDFQLSYEELKDCLTPDKLEALRIFDEITLFTGEKEEQITEGIKTRSFLVRESNNFRFVHRSIMEYFIAEKLYQEIGEDKNVQYLGSIQLSFEIINFIADLAINRNPVTLLKKLRDIKYTAKENFSKEGKWLGANILSLFYTIKRIINENAPIVSGIEEDWSGIVAPGSLLMNADLSKAIFRGADVTESHFENAVLVNSDFTNANLTNIILGETGDIVYTKWGQAPEEIPYSIHSDGKLFKWEIPQNTPSIIPSIIKQEITPPYDICFRNHSMALFIGGVLQAEKEKNGKEIQPPKLLSIDNSGNFVSYYRNNRIMVFEVKSVSNLCTVRQNDVTALYLSPGGNFLAYVVDKKEVYFQDIVNSLSGTIELNDNSSPVTSIAINQKGSDIFIGLENGKIQCFQRNNDTDEFTLIWCKPIHEKAIRNISLNAVANQLLCCGADKKISIIDAKNGGKKQQLQMLLKCNGMRIKNAKGLSAEKRKELIRRGAVEI